VHTARPTFYSLSRAVALQAVIWIGLTVAFAALLRLAGPQSWPNALRFAGVSWLPWMILAPLVYWFTGRFRLERTLLWKSIPAHVLGCATCVAVTIFITTYVGYSSHSPTSRFEERRAAPPRIASDTPLALRPSTEGARAPLLTLPEHEGSAEAPPSRRAERFQRLEGRGTYPHHGPPWWPFLGVILVRANFDAAVYLIVVVAAHALAFYRRAQEREKHATTLAAGLSRAKLEALRLQLQPHFLFNTLNAISTLVHRDPDAADELIGDLSDLLRLSLHTIDHEVPLRQELELLDRYLAIEQARLGDRLKVEKHIDPGVAQALVPTFLLQPIAENAIRHGIEPRAAAGTLRIRAERAGAALVLTVADDGVGLAAKQTAASERRGIGLSNTEQRLATLHGAAASLTIASPESGGVTVRISLPFSTESRVAATPPGGDEPRAS